MPKDLYIFIGNKLISTDTILPLAYELKKRNFVNNVYFVTIDLLTYQSIKKNYVIFQAISKIGKFLFLGNIYKIYRDQKPNIYEIMRSFFFRQIAKINLIPFLLILIIKCILGKVIILHFQNGIFNKGKRNTKFHTNYIFTTNQEVAPCYTKRSTL